MHYHSKIICCRNVLASMSLSMAEDEEGQVINNKNKHKK
jgi:hypothetical protein